VNAAVTTATNISKALLWGLNFFGLEILCIYFGDRNVGKDSLGVNWQNGLPQNFPF